MKTHEIMTENNIISNTEMAGNIAGIVRYTIKGTNVPFFDDEINDYYAYVDHYANESGHQNAKLVIVKNGKMTQKNYKILDDALLALVSEAE